MTMAGRLPEPYGQGSGANLADILERVLDKGIVIAGDIRINLLDIELLTIKLRLIVASVDKAKEMGIDWWEDDPALSSGARRKELARENAELRERLAELEPEREEEHREVGRRDARRHEARRHEARRLEEEEAP
ncbi:gas vesicle protein [Streptomyces sp. NPDC001617]